MHYISYQATSVESRWRPDGQMGMSAGFARGAGDQDGC